MATIRFNHFTFPLLLMALLLSGCERAGKGTTINNTAKKPVIVGVYIVRPQLLENKIMATGSLIANEEIELRSEIPGRIMAIHFEEGSIVDKGELLLKIDDSELQAQLKKLLLEDKQAKDDVYRKEKLLELKAVSQEEYDKTVNQAGIVQAQIELIKAQISKTGIYAAFRGKIGLRQVSTGGFISSSTLIARLQQTDPVKIDFSIPEKYRRKIYKGTNIQFSVEGIDSTFTGEVYALEPKIDPVTRNVSVRAVCPNTGGSLVPGAFAKVEILLESLPDAIAVPSEAIIPQLNGEKVFLYQNGKAKSMIITSGIRTEREVQIVSGLHQGDTVIISGIMQIREEMPVKIKLP